VGHENVESVAATLSRRQRRVARQNPALVGHCRTDNGGSGRVTTDSALSGFGIPDAMKVFCLYLLASMAVLMSGPQDCYRIRDRDSQNSCLAMAKGEKQYCYRIRNRDQQNMCLAQVTREKQYCYRITNRDDQNRCLGLVR
jgi:hypothetical protein